MGSQDEYLRNFCILLTDKGVVPLTDPLQIAVFNCLQNGMKRPTDLSSELGLSSSSLHFVIDKMTESGIVTRFKPDTDKKTVYYSANAVKIAGSMDSSEECRTLSYDAFADKAFGYSGFASVANMWDCYSSEIGLDIDPIRKKYAETLASSLNFRRASMEDAVAEIRERFTYLTGVSFTVYSFSPLTIVFSGDRTIMSKSVLFTSFISKAIECATGISHRASSVETFNGNPNLFKAVFERCEKTEEPYINTSLLHKDENRFLMVDLDGTAGIMTSDIQMDIVDAVYERPLCITDIVNKVAFPRSTITSNLLRMVEEGVISVFYAESGSAYYGLACSILMKKAHAPTTNTEEIFDIMESIKDRAGSFMEGLLLYSISYMKSLGFDSEYLMVVLGAKYMRSCGSSSANNFDAYFGKMSDIAKNIGLSLNVVSVYPLTIGISCEDPSSSMAEGMTFIKGMAHQGLEMASSGIFVRSSEDTPKNKNVSFKEIYPSLSMNPVKGIAIENLEPSATTKKRTSSVKTALLNRSKKENVKSQRTVRYITSMVFMLLFVAVIIAGSSNLIHDDSQMCNLTVDDSLQVDVYSQDGTLLEFPYSVEAGSTVSIKPIVDADMGFVSDGMAFKMATGDTGSYSLTISSDMHIEQLYDASCLLDLDCTFSIYSSDSELEKSAQSTLKFIPSEEYMKSTNGLYVSLNNMIKVEANEGSCISSGEPYTASIPFPSYVCEKLDFKNISVKNMPTVVKTLNLGDGTFYIGDQAVTGEILIDADATIIELQYAENKNVKILANDEEVELDDENRFIIDLTEEEEISISSEETGLY